LHWVVHAEARRGRGGITSFSAHDKGVIAQLPAVLASSFPFTVTHRAAVTKEVMQHLSTMVISPASFSHMTKTMRETHAEAVLIKNEAMADMARLLAQKSTIKDYINIRGILQLEPLGVDVKTPSANYLTNVYLWGFDECQRRSHYQSLTQLTHSPIWRFDHCHKPSKLVRLKDGSKASEGAGVLVGSHMQIMGVWNVQSTSMDEVAAPLRAAAQRSAALGSVSCSQQLTLCTKQLILCNPAAAVKAHVCMLQVAARNVCAVRHMCHQLFSCKVGPGWLLPVGIAVCLPVHLCWFMLLPTDAKPCK
jgi:hypothetical protein